MGQFDCAKPSDGTPLLNCCPPVPSERCGEEVRPIQNRTVVCFYSRKLITDGCRYYTRTTRLDKLDYYATPGTPYASLQDLTYRYSYDYPDDFQVTVSYLRNYSEWRYDSVNVPPRNIFCNPGVPGYQLSYGGDQRPIAYFEYRKLSSSPLYDVHRMEFQVFNEVTEQTLRSQFSSLIQYGAQRVNDAGIQPDYRTFTLDNNFQPAEYGFIPVKPCFELDGMGENAHISGLWRHIEDLPDFNISTATAPCVSPFGTKRVRQVAVFNRVLLTKNYKVETYALTPPVCGSFAISGTPETSNCTKISTVNYTDGLDASGNRRLVTFGPVSDTNHFLVIKCPNA